MSTLELVAVEDQVRHMLVVIYEPESELSVVNGHLFNPKRINDLSRYRENMRRFTSLRVCQRGRLYIQKGETSNTVKTK